MSPSLSWIENSAETKRFSNLTKKRRLPVPEPASETPAPTQPRAQGAPPHRRRPAPPPPSNGPAAGLERAESVPEPRRTPTSGTSSVPVAANQDPWTMTPAQPWTAVAGPTDDLATPGIPELSYPPVMALAARLELFRDWIRQYCGEGAFFVSDPEGLPLLLERVRTSQAVTAVALERALHPLRGLLGSSRANALCIELEDGRLVQTIWATTRLGRIAVGMAPPRPLGPAATAQVRRALLGLFADEENQ